MSDGGASYPRTKTTTHGVSVDAGIAHHVEALIEYGFTLRASCSGLASDHAPESPLTPYVSVQAGSTLDDPEPAMEMPETCRETEFVRRLGAVGERTEWFTSKRLTWLMYPTVSFRLARTQGQIREDMFGSGVSESSLSEQELERVETEYEEEHDRVESLSDIELHKRWKELVDGLTEEFGQDEIPSFEAKPSVFESALNEYEEIVNVLGLSEDDYPQFVD